MVQTNLILENGVSPEGIRTKALQAIEAYLLELRIAWGRGNARTVRISQMDTRLLDIDGVLDVLDTALDGESRNLVLDPMQVPTLGSLALD